MRPSPILIEGYYVKELSFAAKLPEAKPLDLLMQPGAHVQSAAPIEFGDFAMQSDLKAGKSKEDPLRFRFELLIETNKNTPEKFPYKFRIVIIGHFRLDESFSNQRSAEEAEASVRVNAPAILYAAARELMAVVTGRNPLPALVLPSITFIPLPEDETNLSPKTLPKANKATKNSLQKPARESSKATDEKSSKKSNKVTSKK